MSGKIKHAIVAAILLIIVTSVQAYAQTSVKLITNDRVAGLIDQPAYAALMGYAHYAPENLPEKYRSTEVHDTKCGFGTSSLISSQLPFMRSEDRVILEQFMVRASSSQLPESYISSNGNFNLHYTLTGTESVPTEDLDLSGIPDFIEQTAAAFENAHNTLINVLGFNLPPVDDPAAPEYDVYFVDYGFTALYGETFFETESNGKYTSYIKMDNDFPAERYYTEGVNGAIVTAVHEYFHAVQVGYTLRFSDVFFYEMASTWFEDFMYDDINDYLAYLDDVFEDMTVPFNENSGLRQYGMSIWYHYLFKKHDVSIMRKFWENIVSEDGLSSLDNAINSVTGSSFEAQLPEFFQWNYFTGDRADTVNYYKDGRMYPEVQIVEAAIVDTDTTVSFHVDQNRLSGDYVTLTQLQPTTYTVQLSTPDNTAGYAGTAFIVTSGGVVGETAFDMSATSSNTFEISTDRLSSTLVVSPVVTSRIAKVGGGRYSMDINVTSETLLPVEANTLMTSIPNPVNFSTIPEVKIPFVLLASNEVEIKIFTTTGRLVKTFDKTLYNRGIHELKWDGTDENYNKVPSGVYIYIIQGPNIKDMKKMAVIR